MRLVAAFACAVWVVCLIVPASAQNSDVEARADYELANRVGTKEAWEAYLRKYQSGFYSDLARIERDKLAGASGFIFADSDRRYLTQDELRRLSSDQLRIARSEIYARKGRYFRDKALADYFAQFSWYKPSAQSAPLTAVEQANVSLIQSMEH